MRIGPAWRDPGRCLVEKGATVRWAGCLEALDRKFTPIRRGNDAAAATQRSVTGHADGICRIPLPPNSMIRPRNRQARQAGRAVQRTVARMKVQ